MEIVTIAIVSTFSLTALRLLETLRKNAESVTVVSMVPTEKNDNTRRFLLRFAMRSLLVLTSIILSLVSAPDAGRGKVGKCSASRDPQYEDGNSCTFDLSNRLK